VLLTEVDKPQSRQHPMPIPDLDTWINLTEDAYVSGLTKGSSSPLSRFGTNAV
jgi:hypothetical protein